MEFNLQIGMSMEKEYIVGKEDTTCHLGANAPLFATPQMINWMEYTSLEAVKPFLPEGYDTVGARVDIVHLAPTPMGMKVRIVSELTEINGKLLTFKVKAYDEKDKIGEGTHVRGIIQVEKFMKMLADKKNNR